MISWHEFLILSFLIACSGALTDKGTWNFREMRVELIYQLGSLFCLDHRRDWGGYYIIFFSLFKKILLTSICSSAWIISCFLWTWVAAGVWWVASRLPKAHRDLKLGTACKVGVARAFEVVTGTSQPKQSTCIPAFPGYRQATVSVFWNFFLASPSDFSSHPKAGRNLL